MLKENSQSYKKREKLNPNWKGDNVEYGSLHDWLHDRIEIQKNCQHCGKEKKLDLANISQKYKRDVNDYIWLCRSCHMKQDNRNLHLKEYMIKNGHTEETKQKQREASINNNSERFLPNMKGVLKTEEHKKNISLAHINFHNKERLFIIHKLVGDLQ
jgi:hypothetical protein